MAPTGYWVADCTATSSPAWKRGNMLVPVTTKNVVCPPHMGGASCAHTAAANSSPRTHRTDFHGPVTVPPPRLKPTVGGKVEEGRQAPSSCAVVSAMRRC